MNWFVRFCGLPLIASIVITFLLIFICSQMKSTVTFMEYFREEISGVLGVSTKPTDTPLYLRVVNYTICPLMEKVDCVPLKTALHHESICVYDETSKTFSSAAVRRTGVWEEQNFATLLKLVVACADCQFLDIGANIGVYTVTLASMGRRVVAVEPLYTNWLRLTNSIRLNKMENKVTVITNPVSDVHENVTIWVSDINVGGSEVASKSITMSPLRRKPFDKIFRKLPDEVPTIYLDELLPLINFKKAVMKVDIEGYETKAFKRAAKLFEAIEITHVFMEWYGKNDLPLDDIKPLIDFFTSRGYIAHSVDLRVLPSDQEGFRKWPYDIIWVGGRY